MILCTQSSTVMCWCKCMVHIATDSFLITAAYAQELRMAHFKCDCLEEYLTKSMKNSVFWLFWRQFCHLCGHQLVFILFLDIDEAITICLLYDHNYWEMLKTIHFTTEIDLSGWIASLTWGHMLIEWNSVLCKFFIPCIFASIPLPLLWVSLWLTLFCVSFLLSAFLVFLTPYSFSFPNVFIYISEAKWYPSHLNDEAASEKYSDISKVMKLVNRWTSRQEVPEIEAGIREGCDYPPPSVLFYFQKCLYFKADWGTK